MSKAAKSKTNYNRAEKTTARAKKSSQRSNRKSLIRFARTQVTKFAACVFAPSSIIEVRRLPSGHSTWHLAKDLSCIADSLVDDNLSLQNIYVGANARKAVGGSKANDVARATCLFADFDDTSVATARSCITVAGLPRPTLLLRSGHGAHAYWRLTRPVSNMSRWSSLQKRLAKALDSDRKVHDAPRIMRMPGFMNVKKPKKPIICRLAFSKPDLRYRLKMLEDALPRATDVGGKDNESNAKSKSRRERTSESRKNQTQRRKRSKEVVDGQIISAGHRNGQLTSLAGSMRCRGMTSDEIEAALLAVNSSRCRPPLGEDEVAAITNSVARYDPSGATPCTSISNATIQGTGENRRIIPVPMAGVLEVIRDRSGEWPHRVDDALFVHDAEGIHWLSSTASVFGWLSTLTGRVDWRRAVGCVTKEEVFHEVRRTARQYQAVSEVPHEPKASNHYYACDIPEAGSGETLRCLLNRYEPATQIDADLMQAALMTLAWGGPPGDTTLFRYHV